MFQQFRSTASFERNSKLDKLISIINIKKNGEYEDMKNKIMIMLSMLATLFLLESQQLINVEMGLSSFVGGVYYQNNEKKDFEYKSNHNWYLNLSKTINDNILTSAEIRYYPELFDKKLYLYSAKVKYMADGMFDFAWEYDRIGLGNTNLIFNNVLNDLRSDQNFITDYRFNGAVLTQKFNNRFDISYRAGGNDLNTGIGAIDFTYKQKRITINQSFLMVSRDNKFNAKALNINNLIRWNTDKFVIQNMLHSSFIDYYRKGAEDKSFVFKDLIETRLALTPYLQPHFSFYYEAENWTKFKVYEINSVINLLFNKYEFSPTFKYVNYLDSIQREYSLLLNYKLHQKWDIGLYTNYLPNSNKQDIIGYGLQTKFNFPLSSLDIKSLLD
ncbi:hypothetical protein JEZ13_12315 [bacterium]|nr:hypothetical protein [bacterium]